MAPTPHFLITRDVLSSTLHHFSKRDPLNQGTIFLIILAIIGGSIALTCVGYAIHKTFGFGYTGDGAKPCSVAQQEYMAEVRVRGMNRLAREGRIALHEDGGKRKGHETVYSVGTGSGSNAGY
jgi:hypothetical protein